MPPSSVYKSFFVQQFNNICNILFLSDVEELQCMIADMLGTAYCSAKHEY
jgi:hypothetical protein